MTSVNTGKAGAPFALRRFTPYRIVALGHALSGRLAAAYTNENLTIPEWRVLAVVGETKEMVAARDVVRRTPMDKMMVSRAVISLEKKGFVVRAPDPKDKRVSMVSLSDAGRAVFNRVVERAVAFESGVLDALTSEEQSIFSNILSKLEAEIVRNSD